MNAEVTQGRVLHAKAHTHFLHRDATHSPRAAVHHLEDFCLIVWMAYFYYVLEIE